MKNGLNLPSDEAIVSMAAAAGFTVGVKVHVRGAPTFTAAPIREFSWCDGRVVAVWMSGACRTPLEELVLLPVEPEVLAEMNSILNGWAKDLRQAATLTGCESAASVAGDWIPEYQLDCQAAEEIQQLDDEDNQDSTEYPEDPADEQRD
jgi:hypothetical protein